MIGDFPIQFSIYTNCLLHHVFLAWEACGQSCQIYARTRTHELEARSHQLLPVEWPRSLGLGKGILSIGKGIERLKYLKGGQRVILKFTCPYSEPKICRFLKASYYM